MLRHWMLLLVTVAATSAIPRSSSTRELQRLVRLPRLEFSKPLEFERRFGFVPFADANTATREVSLLLKREKDPNDKAKVYLEAAKILDSQGDVSSGLAHYSRAVDLFRRRVEIAPREVESLAGLGEALAAIGRFAEAESTLDKADEIGDLPMEILLARARLYRERAWFSAAGETMRYSSSPFISQLISMAVESPPPNRIEESRKYLRLAEQTLARAFETSGNKEERLVERAAFRSFQKALELAFTQIQNEELHPRELELSLYNDGALADLVEAAALSDDPALIAAAALTKNLSAERIEGSNRSADAYVRGNAARLQRLVDEGGENSAQAGEFLGALQFHVLKDVAGARRTLRRAVDTDSSRHRAWEILVLASAYAGSEQFVEAAEARVAALPHPRSSVLLVKSYDMEGDLTRAELSALTAVTSYPNDLFANLALAAVLLKDGNFRDYLWRIDEALNKAEKALGASRNYQNRVDFILLKSIYLGLADRGEQAKALLQTMKPSAPELQEVLRALD